MAPNKRKSPGSYKGASHKAICDLLMIKSTEPEERDKACRDGSVSKALFYSYTCRKCGEIKWKETTAGATNPYNHLVTCYGSPDVVEEMYLESQRRTSLGQGSTLDSFLKSCKATPREDAVFGWINAIVDKSWPVSYVEDETVRNFSVHGQVRLSAKYLKQVLFRLVELVQEAIGAEMAQAPIGAIMHDGWSKTSTHYFGLYACYCLKVAGKLKPTTALLAVSPIQQAPFATEIDSDDDVEPTNDNAASTRVAAATSGAMVETATFNADAHCGFIRSTFQQYGAVDFNRWCVAQICDNASVNRSIAMKLGIKHIGCKSHQLALDVKDMLKADADTATLLQHVHKTMSSIKTKNSNAALLRNVTELKPVLDNKTRWSGKFYMVERYCRIYEDIIKASHHDHSSIDITELAPIARAKKVQSMLAEIDAVTKALQESKLPLAHGRKYLDDLSRQVHRNKNNPTHALFECKLSLKKSALMSQLAPHHVFESGVIKIQSGNWEGLTPEEEEACTRLLKNGGTDEEILETPSDSPVKMSDRIKRMRSTALQGSNESRTSPYHDLSFLYASAAEVERLWSKALYIFVQQRRKMHPRMLETLLYLKENRRLWDKAMVMEAMATLKDTADDMDD